MSVPNLLIRPATADDAEELLCANEAAWNAGMSRVTDNKLDELAPWVVEGNDRARRFYEREGWSADGEKKSSMFDLRELRYRRRLDL